MNDTDGQQVLQVVLPYLEGELDCIIDYRIDYAADEKSKLATAGILNNQVVLTGQQLSHIRLHRRG